MASPHALPLPIAALLRRARNATDPTRRHLAAYYAWEASLRLTVAAEPPEDLSSLAMPSVGHFVKAMPPRPGSLGDPALLALHALLAEVGTEQRQAPRSTTAQKLLALLPAYRNKVIGHGSTRTEAFNEGAARVFLEALEPAWKLGVFLPPEAVLLFVDQVEIDAEGDRRARLVRLEGLASEREGEVQVGEEVRPERVYLRHDGHFTSLHPWVLFEGGEERERLLFFNGHRNAAEYLDYVSGEIVKSKALAAAFPGLDADVQAALRQERGERAAAGAASLPPPKPEAQRRPGPWKPVAAAVALLSLGVGGAVYWKSQAGGASGALVASAVPATESLVPTISTDAAVQAEFRRGIESLLQADIYAAENALVSVRDKAPREPWPHAVLAMVGGLQGHYEDSQREIDEASALTRGQGGRDAELMSVIDRSLDPDYAGVMRAWGEIEARHKEWVLGRLLVAYYYSGKGPAEERLARFDGVLGIADRHALVYLLKSRTQTNLGKLPEALETVGAGLARHPTAPWLIAQRGVVRMLMGQPSEARADLEEAVARKGPFSAHVLYATTLLGTGKPEDEAQFGREAEALLGTKNVDDRLSFMCAHAMGLLRQGRIKEADGWIDKAGALATEKGKQGTLVRCVLMPVWSDVVLGRFEHAEITFQKLGRIWEGFGLTKSDEANGKTLLKLLKGTVAAERGDLAAAEAEFAELERNGKKTEELGYRIAIARKQEVQVPDPPAGQALFLGALRVHTQARALEVGGKLGEAERSYGKLVAMREACARSISDADLLCGVLVADALVRRAALEAKRGAAGDARATLDALATFWPRPDPDLSLVKRAAELRKSLPPAGGR